MAPLTDTMSGTRQAPTAVEHTWSKQIRRIARGLGVILLLIAILALAGAGYEAIASRGDALVHPAPGQLVDVGGFSLHIQCLGFGVESSGTLLSTPKGTPTVVLDAGLGGTSLDWNLVQSHIGQTTRVCAYDRAGMGWSESGPAPRTPSRIADELHTLLGNAGIAGPYILVGHSLAGKNMRMFALKHPNEVAGMVLVDARSEVVDEHTPPEEAHSFQQAVAMQGNLYKLARKVGLVRLFGASLEGAEAMTDKTRLEMALFASEQRGLDATAAEARERATDDGELQAAPLLGDLPLLVLAAGESMKQIPYWPEAQQRQAALSTNGRLIVVEESGHAIHLEQPARVIDAVQQVVDEARGHDADASPDSQTEPFDFQSIDAFVTSQMQAMHIPGVALGIVAGDQVVYSKGFGIADPSGQRMTAQTPFILGSTSKSFTALAIMQLVEAGKIDLDAPVQRYLPWFQVGTSQSAAAITVRHLLNQVSGIPTRAVGESLTGNGEETLEHMVRALSHVALIAPPGTTYQYSNLNYTTLGLLVQSVTGQSYESYIQQHIFEPLKMANSFTSQNEALQSGEGLATGYRWWYGLALPSDLPFIRGSIPAGFLISSVEDMAHYLVAQMNSGRYLDASLLSPSGITQLHAPAAAMNEQQVAYGMGWVISPARGAQGEPSIWHGGDTANFHSDMIILPRKQLGIIILTNVNGELARTTNAQGILAQGVQRLLLGQQPPAASPFWQRYLLFDATLILCSVLALVSVIRLLRRRKQPLKRGPLNLVIGLALPLLWEIGLPIALLLALPAQTQASWPLILLYFPDLGYWLLLITFLLLATAALRVILAPARLGGRDINPPTLPTFGWMRLHP